MKAFAMQLLQSVLFILITVWALLSLLLYLFQPQFVYFPMSDLIADPGDAGLDFEDVSLTTDDQVTIHGWFLPHPRPRATLLFLHGNGGNISHRLEKLRIFHDLELSVFIIDYRGYGRSEGSPSEHGTYRDAEAAWRHLSESRQIRSDAIIVYGESLGAAPASRLAGRYQPGALIIESAFTSIADMGRHYYPYLPVKLLTRIKYPVVEYVREARCPVLIIHSPDDDIVPYAQGRALFDTATEPRSFLEIQGDHNSGFYLSGELYRQGLDQFINNWFS